MANFNCGRNVLRQLVNNKGFNTSGSLTNPLLFNGQGLRYRKLEVILTTSVDKLGKAGETVKVAPGYFRNHLMPKLLAVPNIEKYAYLVREQRKLYQREEVETVKVVPQTKQDIMKEYQAAANRLEKARLVLRRQVQSSSSLNELRSPVTKEELAAEVARQLSVNIQPDNLYLPSALSTFGEFEVPLLLPKNIPLPEGKIKWTLDVKVRRK
ncbi:hypothetical protein AQUCO_01600247v1 [Aquilegia coerulea]|uniref:Large ribosomal subunit protein bL9c n=1 Tax=Aquilegia coerulea TaxID=218851 RepID=A0A2G5DQS1_AQUCA|nr:hypothetical protein AQUCO_01600247v1 [Aquilegia coerulea]